MYCSLIMIACVTFVAWYACHFGRLDDASWRGGKCECCRLAVASFGASV